MDFKNKVSRHQQTADALDGNVMTGLEQETAFNGNVLDKVETVFAKDGSPIRLDTQDALDGNVMTGRHQRSVKNGNVMDDPENMNAFNGRKIDPLRDQNDDLPPPVLDDEEPRSKFKAPTPFDKPSPFKR